VSAPLNLARRPFRNERLPTLALAAGCAGLVLTTAWHALVARDLAPGRSRDVATEVVAIEKEIEELRSESAQLRQVDAPADKLKEWAAVKKLVDRRMFSWTGLFRALEEALPPGVKLASISPSEARGATELKLVAVGRSNEDAFALMASLQEHPDFEGAFLNSWTEGREGFDIVCTVRYVPKARPAARGKAAAGSQAATDPPAEAGE
jgi:Tfp pilus assembly protein PilN